jgi:carbamoyltransferase
MGTTAAAIGNGKDLAIYKEIHFPHSLGLLYSAFTYYAGFKVNSGEYKLMGLAPYGTPKYEKIIRDNLIDLKPDGSFRLNLDYFNYCTGLTMTNRRFDALFGRPPPRNPETWLEQKHMDIAASIQAVLKMRSCASPAASRTRPAWITCVSRAASRSTALLLDGRFRNIWVQPAAGDAGGAPQH